MSELYRAAMDGVYQKTAMQAIRKVIRGKDPEGVKLEKLVEIVHAYEDDAEQAELAAERRAIEEDEAKLRREKIDEMFDDMAEPLNKLTIRKGEKRDP